MSRDQLKKTGAGLWRAADASRAGSDLMANLPCGGEVLDPASGSGGLLVPSASPHGCAAAKDWSGVRLRPRIHDAAA